MIYRIAWISLLVYLLPLLSFSQGEKWNRLYSESAKASSFLQNNWNKYQENYHPNYLLDDNPRTAWVEGSKGQGIGESITLRVSPLRSAKAVKLNIRNGFQKTRGRFVRNSSPKDVLITLLSGSQKKVTSRKVRLKRKMGWQSVKLNIPGNKGFAFVRITILSVYPGTTYKDTCLSDIQTFVQSNVQYNKRTELAKRDKLYQWVKERRKTAKYFANKSPKYPFASTHFIQKRLKSVNTQAIDKEIKEKETQLSQISRQKRWHKGVLSKNAMRIKKPDGLFNEMSDLVKLTRVDSISLFESKKALATHEKNKYGTYDKWVSNYKVVWAKGNPKRVKQVHFWVKEAGQERISWENRREFLLTFDSKGRIESAYIISRANDEMTRNSSKNRNYKYIRFHYDSNGKIHQINHNEKNVYFTRPTVKNLTRLTGKKTKKVVTYKSTIYYSKSHT